MSPVQKFFMAILPRSWAESMRTESRSWMIRCTGCGASRSVWDVGGIRWKACSVGKRTLVRCPHCGGIRVAVVEPQEASQQ